MKLNIFKSISIKALLYSMSIMILVVVGSVLAGIFWITGMQADDSATIDMAGRQRMLSQRMTKELYLYQQERSQDNLNNLKNSVWTFNETLEALILGGDAPIKIDRNGASRRPVNKPSPEAAAQLARTPPTRQNKALTCWCLSLLSPPLKPAAQAALFRVQTLLSVAD